MKTFLLRLIRRTDGSQLLPYTLVGGAIALLVLNADVVALALDRFADVLRTVAGHLDLIW